MNQPKPFKHHEYLAAKKNIPIDSAALRYTNAQPIVFISENGEKRPNKRKLNELPYLISKFEADNVAITAVEHCFMNYNFLYYKFLISDTNAILFDLQSINAHTRDIRNVETKQAALQLQLFSLVFLVSMQSLKRYPESFAIILTSRMLMFYKCFKYFQKFIDESDLLSPFETSSLISCYQYLQPPGGGLLLTLDTHKTEIKTTILDRQFLITCSDSINLFYLERLQTIGESKYPIIYDKNIKEIETVTVTRVFFITTINNKNPNIIIDEIDGGYIIMTKSTIMCIKFDTKVYFSKQFTDSELTTIFVIPDRYILAQFENRNYFEIYDLFTGEFVSKQSFDSTVKFLICSLNNTYTIDLSTKTATEITIGLDKGELQKFILLNENPAEKLKFQLLYKIPPRGIDFFDLAFQVKENGGDTSTYNPRNFLATFEDGAICFIGDELSEKKEISEKKVDIAYITSEKTGPLKILSATNHNILLKDKRGNLYILDESGAFRKISGQFQKAQIIQSGYLAASSFGTIHIFYLKLKSDLINKEHSLLEYAKFDAHFDNVVYLEFQGNIQNNNFENELVF